MKYIRKNRSDRTRKRRCKQALDDLEETRRYCKLKEEAPDLLFGELALEENVYLLQGTTE
jgi:hypothetical protein